MERFERWAKAVRHSRALEGKERLWRTLRPIYDRVLALLAPQGLRRTINGTDLIVVPPLLRGVTDCYEPEVWAHLMNRVRLGDHVVDVGAHWGLYTVAFARRVGPRGRVIALEPDAPSYEGLRSIVELNGMSDRVSLVRAAAASFNGSLSFRGYAGTVSHVTFKEEADTENVKAVRLDSLLAADPLDILKIDVEGFEAAVIAGSAGLFARRHPPRLVYVEVHPYAWQTYGLDAESLIEPLLSCGYEVRSLDGQSVTSAMRRTWLVATAGEGNA